MRELPRPRRLQFRAPKGVGQQQCVRYKKRVRTVLIAAKELAFAKTRLAPVLSDGQRRSLAEAMFRDVLGAALASKLADRVAVVSSDRGLLELARSCGAVAIDEEFPRGLNAAVRLATSALIGAGASTTLTVLSDIPLVAGADIDVVFAAAGSKPGAILVPSRDLSGTNMIARTPADVIATEFGRLSLVRHVEACRRAGLGCRILRLAGPALDLDQRDDLTEFMRLAGPGKTLSELARLGIALH